MCADARRILATLTLLLLWLVPAGADTAPTATAAPSPDGYVARLEAALLLQTLNADLLSHDSATLTLERWCSSHRLASPARITARRVPEAYQAPSAEQRRQLHVTQNEQVRYRRVQLLCGAVVLSEADNWYVPARLTPAMNKLLDSTDTPFGVAVQALHFQRHTIAAEVLWRLLPPGWEMTPPAATGAAGELCFPAHVLLHRALLTLPDGTPFSEVVETYTSDALTLPRLAAVRRCQSGSPSSSSELSSSAGSR